MAQSDSPSHPPGTRFLAVTAFTHHERMVEETQVISADHPEIAYQLAVNRGREERYGRKFVGILELRELEPDEQAGTSSEGTQGIPPEPPPKEELVAFQDPKWTGSPPGPDVIAAAVEPDYFFELEGLDDVDWRELGHAYGQAKDVPVDLQRLASRDSTIRKQAIWELGGSIYHQGTIYSATPHAVAFLVQLLGEASLPNRTDIAEFLKHIADSAAGPIRVTKRRAEPGGEAEIRRNLAALMGLGEMTDDQWEAAAPPRTIPPYCEETLNAIAKHAPRLQQLADENSELSEQIRDVLNACSEGSN